MHKKIAWLVLVCLMCACSNQSKTPAESAIEEKQANTWLQYAESGKRLLNRWEQIAAIQSENITLDTVSETVALISEYRQWKNQVEIEGKISEMPTAISKIISISDDDWRKAVDKMSAEKLRLDNEESEKQAAARQYQQALEEKERITRQEEISQKNLIEQKRISEEERRRKVLAASIAEADRTIINYTQRYSSVMGHLGNQAGIVLTADGYSLQYLSEDDFTRTIKIRVQNEGGRGGEYANIEEVFLDFTVQEMTGNKCSESYGREYHYKTIVAQKILQKAVVNIELAIPKFFDRSCVRVAVAG